MIDRLNHEQLIFLAKNNMIFLFGIKILILITRNNIFDIDQYCGIDLSLVRRFNDEVTLQI